MAITTTNTLKLSPVVEMDSIDLEASSGVQHVALPPASDADAQSHSSKASTSQQAPDSKALLKGLAYNLAMAVWVLVTAIQDWDTCTAFPQVPVSLLVFSLVMFVRAFAGFFGKLPAKPQDHPRGHWATIVMSFSGIILVWVGIWQAVLTWGHAVSFLSLSSKEQALHCTQNAFVNALVTSGCLLAFLTYVLTFLVIKFKVQTE